MSTNCCAGGNKDSCCTDERAAMISALGSMIVLSEEHIKKTLPQESPSNWHETQNASEWIGSDVCFITGDLRLDGVLVPNLALYIK